MKIEMVGVPNFYKVDHRLYRSAQPTKEGMRNLRKLGIKTVINLRWMHSDSDELEGTDLLHDEYHTTAWSIGDSDVIWFLDLVTTPEGAPFLVHCQHGADRTGCMVAMYRMVMQGWSRDEAIQELKGGGFGFHDVWSNIPRYLSHVDIVKIRDKIRKMLGARYENT